MTDKEKKLVEEIINKYNDFIIKFKPTNGFMNNFNVFVKKLKREYKLLPEYPTLREYINDNSKGAYHHFIFNLNIATVNVVDVCDFETYFKSELLDEYVVVADEKKDNKGNCENYQCNHYLKIKLKED